MRIARAGLASGRDATLLIWLIVLGIIGAGVAGYLTYTHYDRDALVCTVGSCETVQQSAYSTISAVPVALLGLAMYLLVGVFAFARVTGRSLVSAEPATVAVWAVLLAGALYAGYLTYVEIWVIDAICQWCVVSAVITTLMFALQSVMVWRALGEPRN